jgi:hypothetical protein
MLEEGGVGTGTVTVTVTGPDWATKNPTGKLNKHSRSNQGAKGRDKGQQAVGEGRPN